MNESADDRETSSEKPPAGNQKKVLRVTAFALLELIIVGGAFAAGVQMARIDCAQQIASVHRCPSTSPVATTSPLEPSVIDATESSQTLDESSIDEDANVPLESADLVPTTDWQLKEFGKISAMLPPQVNIREDDCSTHGRGFSNFEKCFYITDHVEQMRSSIGFYIKTKPYLGGSRRAEAGFSEDEGRYSIGEKLFGNYKALEIFFICQIVECTSTREILLVVDDQLVLVSDGIYYYPEPDRKYDPRESPVVNTIVSTMK